MDWSLEQVAAVGNRGTAVPGRDPEFWRKNQCGASIKWDDYGNRDSKFGWEIDHIIPKSVGGSDGIDNLRPLQWQNNVGTSNGRLTCVVGHS